MAARDANGKVGLAQLWDAERGPLRYTLLAIALAVLAAIPGNALYNLLTAWTWWKEWRWMNLVLLVGGIGALVILISSVVTFDPLVRAIRRRIAEPLPPVSVTAGEAAPRRGVIALVSLRPGEKAEQTSAWQAVDYYTKRGLEYAWLLHTPESEQPAKAIRDHFKPQGLNIKLLLIKDANDLITTFKVATEAYQHAEQTGLSSDMVVADITGGTKWMSIGMAYAGLPETRQLQYMRSKNLTSEGVHDPSGEASEPVVLNIEPKRTILQELLGEVAAPGEPT